MFRLRTTLLVSTFALLIAASGYANTILVANLTNSQENPPTNPTLSTGRPEAGVVRHGHIRFKRRDDGYDLFVYYLQYRRHRVANARPERQPHRRTYPRRSLGDSDYERTCRLGIFRLAV